MIQPSTPGSPENRKVLQPEMVSPIAPYPPVLLATKLHIPAPPDRFLARPRLAERLHLLHTRTRLVLVSAPTGYGKTTAVTEWLYGHAVAGEEKVGWFTIDEGDNEPVRFWDYFIAALDSALPGLSPNVRPLLHSRPLVDIEVVLVALINALAAHSQIITLVLDDYHLVSHPTIQRGLAYLLDHQPANLHLIITSRTDPPAPVPLARLRVRGHLAELRAADLSFTGQEAYSLLHLVMGLDISPAHTDELQNKTEGWAAALQLAALLMRSYKEVSSFIANFSSNQRFMLDYLAEEVFERQPPSIQNFLLQTSVVESLHPALVEELTGCEDGFALLRLLEEGNLFLSALPESAGWYRYHYLFRQYLMERLERTQAEHVPLLQSWAARWYTNHDLPVPAGLAKSGTAFEAAPVTSTADRLPPTRPVATLVEPLTARELAVLRRLVTTTLNTTEIADEMMVAASTVRTHIKNIYSKLGVQNRLEAIQRATELGLLSSRP